MKVNFLIAGTQKGGTTALTTLLLQHPQVSFAKNKETHFFDTDYFFSVSPPPYHIYHHQFDIQKGCRVIGEATPIYMYWIPAIQRIKEYNPDMKLIFLLRNPVDRAFSHYMMEKRSEVETLPFSEAIRIEEKRLANYPNNQHRTYSYIDRGYYSRQIKRILNEFPKEQLLFLKTEELRDNYAASIQRTCNFLYVNELSNSAIKMDFSSNYPEMNIDDRRFLYEKFSKEIDELEELLGWDCSSWRE